MVEDATSADGASLVGEEAHIVSKAQNGPRYYDALPLARRDHFENLLLLCNRCHKIIDDQVNEYTADVLRQIKKDHEDAVREVFSEENAAKLRDDVIYAEYLERWEDLSELDYWNVWTSYLLSADPSMRSDLRDGLAQLAQYLVRRVWPHRYADLENAFHSFLRVLDDLLYEFNRHSIELTAAGVISTERFYKTAGWLESKEYHWRIDQYEFHTDVVRDLTLELTRAANLMCDIARGRIFSRYRLEEGRLTVTMGPFSDLSSATFVPEYRDEERASQYPGLAEFLEERIDRDYTVGSGAVAVRGYGHNK